MKIRSFVHIPTEQTTTLRLLKGLYDEVSPSEMLSGFAYATNSGAAKFDLTFGDNLWDRTKTRWLFALDYGRTEPSALKFISRKTNADVRIYDGDFVVAQEGYVPRRDFHMKSSFLLNAARNHYGMLAGSGNFSSRGLSQNIECGIVLRANTDADYRNCIQSTHDKISAIWDGSSPLADIIDQYEEGWSRTRQPPPDAEERQDPAYDALDGFWIEAGYVTRNRGPTNPGNQIDMPRGMHKYFGMEARDLVRNEVIGEIRFRTPTGNIISRNLRLGNNLMEKISLPIPEDNGLDIYDGKTILFQRAGNAHDIHLFESDEFDRVFGRRLGGVKIMASGRRYGYLIR